MINAEENLLKTFGSPLYVYDNEVLTQRCNEIKNFEQLLQSKLHNNVIVSMHYSTKANSNPSILSVVKNCGLNTDCMSPLELELNKKSGFTSERMLYVCNNIDEEEMKLVHDNNLLICLDSISQVEMWGKLYAGTEIMVRINPGTAGVGHSQKVITSGKLTKFGICEENLTHLFEVAKKYNLKIIGTHQHLGSLFLDDKVEEYIAGVQAGLKIIEKYFKDIQIVDLGGGFGVPYKLKEEKLDLVNIANKLLPILKEFILKYPSVREFKFEPGRYIPCEAGSLLGTVTAIKYENETWWIGTDIGMNQLVRPSMYDSYHELEIIYKEGKHSNELIKANFCGNICESGDIIAKERLIYLPKVGDVVKIYNAGAYGFSMASNYTGRLRPAEVIIYKNAEPKLIRKRETLENLMSNIVF